MRRILPVIAAAALLVAFAAPASSAGIASTWHRDNYGNGHERLICTSTSGVWECRYDSMPNYPERGDRSNGIGSFTGSEQDAWWCPPWAQEVCDSVERHVVGATVYRQQGNPPVTEWEELIFTDGSDGLAPMYMYLVGPGLEGVCPWYPTWDEALENGHECFFSS